MSARTKLSLKEKTRWTCPRCGKSLASRKIVHDCLRDPVEVYFSGKPPALRAVFDRLLDTAKKNGPVTPRVVKNTVVLEAHERFARIDANMGGLRCEVFLDKGSDGHGAQRIDKRGKAYVCIFRLFSPEQVDSNLALALRRAYDLDCTRHGARPDGGKR